MLTPQEVSTHSFTKAVMGGYNMAMVDEFLDELTDDYTSLYKENAALKAKIKVLVEKVEEYRATEDSMRATLLSAQKMADSIIKEAESKRDDMLCDAESLARERKAQIDRDLQEAEDRLRKGRVELAAFIAESREVCNRQLAYLDQLPELSVSVADSAAAEAEEIERKVLSFAEEVAQNVEEPVQERAEESEATQEDPYPEGDPFAKEETPEELGTTRRVNLSDLKFGRNYKGND